MVVTAIAGVISVFSFDSVRSVIRESMRVDQRQDFEGLVESLRYVSGRLDQCTCNFRGLTWTVGDSEIALPSPAQVRRLANPQGPPICGANAGDVILAEEGQRYFRTQVDAISLVGVQYMPTMNIARARLRVDGTTQQAEGSALSKVSRQLPLMFSTRRTGTEVTVIGCIGMTH